MKPPTTNLRRQSRLLILGISFALPLCSISYRGTSYAANVYEPWFTVSNHPDGVNHTAHVLHDGSWSPAWGTGSYTRLSAVQTIWIDGFRADQAGWSKELFDQCFAMAVLKDASSTSVPRYIEKSGLGAAPIDARQWTSERRQDNQGNWFTSHYLKHRNIIDEEWYDYGGIADFNSRKSMYFAAVWAMAFQPARSENALTEDAQLAAVKRTIATAKAEWKYGNPVLDGAIKTYFDVLSQKAAMEAADVQQYMTDIAVINGNAAKWTKVKNGISALSWLYDSWDLGCRVSTAYQVSKLYHQLVVLDEVEQRIAEIERLAAVNPNYDPALTAAVADVRSAYSAMMQPSVGGALGWIASETAFLHEFQQQNLIEFNKMVRDGIKYVGTSLQLYATVVAGISLSGPQAALVAGAFIVWEASSGLLGEWDKMNTCEILMNLEELLYARLTGYSAAVNFLAIDYTLASGICQVSSMGSYAGYHFYDLLAQVCLQPDGGVYYWLKWAVLYGGGQLGSVEAYRDLCLQYRDANLCVVLGLDMAVNTHYLSQSPSGSGLSVSTYLDYLRGLENVLVYSPRATNDDFETAATLSRNSGTETGENYNASVQSGEPAHNGRGPFNSVWWRFTPPSDGLLNIDTHGSGFDTVLAIYTGNNVTSLTLVRSNDDDGAPLNNSGLITVLLSAGVTYRIAVAGYSSSDIGSVVVNWSFTAGGTPTIEGSVLTAGGYGVPSVTLSASNGGGATATDGNGHYSLQVPFGWTGSISLSKADWSFTPGSRAYAGVVAPQLGQDFAAACNRTYEISGTIHGNNGANPDCDIVANPGAFSARTRTTAGNYTLQVPSGWSGTVTPNKGGFNFSPANRTFVNVTANAVAQDFTATVASSVYVSGQVTGPSGINPGVTIYGSGGYEARTDSSGNYTLYVPQGWTGPFWPVKGGYTFNPPNRSASNVQSPQTGKNFSGSLANGWTTMTSGLRPGMDAYTIRCHPGNINELWLCCGDWDSPQSGQVGLYKSTDGGSSWNNVTSGLTVSGYPNYVYDLVFVPGQPSTMFAATGNGFFKSSNGGSSWTRPTVSGSLDTWQRFDGLAIDPVSPSTMFAVQNQYAVHRSSDGGSTWEAVCTISSPGWFDGACRIQVDPSNHSRVYMVNSGGMYVSTNQGGAGTWRNISGVRDFAVDAKRGLVFVTWNGSGDYFSCSQDGCQTWQTVNYRQTENQIWGTAVRVAVDSLLGDVYVAVHSPSTVSQIIRAVPTGTPSDWQWAFEPFAQGWPLNFETTFMFDCLNAGTSRRLCGHAESASQPLLKRDLPSVVTVSGTVSGSPVANPGTWVCASAGGGDGVTTSGGIYELYVPSGWSGSLFPIRSGFTYTPPSRELTSVTSAQSGEDFAAATVSMQIRGIVRDGASNAIIGAAITANPPANDIKTNLDGTYVVSVGYGWTGTLSATKAGWSFIPVAASYTNLVADLLNQDFIGNLSFYTLSGRVTNSSGAGVEGCSVEFSNGGGSCLTDANGDFSVSVPHGWAGMATPLKPKYAFTPTQRVLSGVTSSQGSLDFAAYEALSRPSPTGCGISVTNTTPTLSWGDVENESGYVAQIFSGGSCSGSTIHASPQLAANTVSYTVPAGVLSSGQTYSWQVQAKGEGTAYWNSPWSSCCSFSTPTSPDGGAVTNGLVAYYPFDGDASDASGNANHGSASNGVSYVTGARGQAASFDGVDDYVRIPNSTSINFTGAMSFTVSAWIKANSQQVDLARGDNDIIEKWSEIDRYPYTIRYLNQNSTEGYVGHVRVARYGESGNPIIYSSCTFTDRLHHVAFVKSDAILRLYVDGVLDGETADTAGVNTGNAGPLFVGQRGRGSGINRFCGIVDELRVYDRALSGAEIAALADVSYVQMPLSARMLAGRYVLTWSLGTLLSADDLAGPWKPVAGATPPWTNSPSGGQKFYRLKQ